ncbi:MAG: hypothetical protein M3069_24510 [Chloroflexota bacterium]|nr:hypothetical protein [Chloroflexota bacterium]
MRLQPSIGRVFNSTWPLRWLVLALGLTTILMTVAMREVPRVVSAAQAPILWGAWAGSSPLDSGTLDAFERRAGKRPSIIHWGQPWWHDQGYTAFSAPDFDAVRNRGAIPLLDWGSWDYCCGTNQPNFNLASVYNGAHDGYLIQWAQAARAWNHPFFLRLNPEMNGWWLPWSEQTNGNQPGDFVRSWRHVIDVFRAQGANNVSWVWCPNVSSPLSTPLADMYPGDNYVDWTCMDGYNWGTDQGKQWQTFSEIFSGSAFNGYHDTYQEVLDVAPGKPIMIGETGTSHNGGDPAAWLSDALNVQLPDHFPRIKALVWFNWNAGDVSLGWPIESSPATQRAFAENIGSTYFASNDFGSMGPVAIAPIGGNG